MIVGFLVSRGATSSYEASARLLFPSAQPTGDVSESLADTAEGIATSRSQVETVLQDIDANRDPSEVAHDQVLVEPLGQSGVVEVTVTDPDPQVAADLANGLAERITRVQFDAISEGTRELLASVREQIAALSGKISVSQREAASTGLPQPGLSSLIEREANLRADRRDLVSQLATLPKPTILDPVDRSAVQPVSSGRIQEIVLGGLVGLVLGIALAALLETLRPGIVGREGLRRAFDAPILGTFSPRLDGAGRRDLASATRLLGAAAAAAGIKHVKLTRAGKTPVDANLIAAELQAGLGKLTSQDRNGDHGRRPSRSALHTVPGETQTGLSSHTRSTREVAVNPRRSLWEGTDSERTLDRVPLSELTIDVVDLKAPLPHDGEGGIGLVILTPGSLERTAVDRVQDLVAVTGWPVLGLISSKE